MAENAVETQTKNGEKSDKDYSMKCIQKTCTIVYKGKRKDRRFLNWVPLIESFGGDAVRATGFLSMILGIWTILSIGHHLPEKFCFWIPLFFVNAAFYSVGVTLFDCAKYVEATKCKKCGQNYGYEERENPDIKEITTEDSYDVTITRYWKCKYCGYKDSTKSSEDIRTRKGEKGKKPRQIECEKCGKIGIYFECRDPDEKVENFSASSITTTIRYYKCENCGHVNIEVEKRDVTNTDGTPCVSITEGRDPRILN